MLRPDATRWVTCGSVVVELRGFEPLTPCMPLMCGEFTTPRRTSRAHTTTLVRGAVEGRVVRRREAACSAVSGKSLARRAGTGQRPKPSGRQHEELGPATDWRWPPTDWVQPKDLDVGHAEPTDPLNAGHFKMLVGQHRRKLGRR